MFNKKRHRKIKNVLVITLIAMLTFSLMGCNLTKKSELETKDVEKLEYYSKRTIEMPEESNPISISKASDGGLYVITEKDDKSETLWHVNDNEQWEKKNELNDLIGIKENAYCLAYASTEGEIFAIYNENVDAKDEFAVSCSNMNYCYIDAAGNKKEINLELKPISEEIKNELKEYYGKDGKFENEISLVKFIDDKIYVSDASSNFYEIDKSNGTSKCIFENNTLEYVNNFYVYDRTLMMWDGEMIYYEGLDSHDKEDSMCERFLPFFSEAKQLGTSINMDVEDNELWTLSGDKICSINLDNDETSKNKATGYSPNEYVLDQSTAGDNVYALANKINTAENVIYKYSREEADSVSGNGGSGSLKIWTLEGSQTVETAVRCFTDKHPDINVEIEVGMDNEDSGVTENDAIKNLNAELLAGNGPDIIYMDGLSSDKYIESGELLDLTDEVNKLKDSGEYFNNVLDSFNKDGKVYVVPSSFYVIEKIGTEETLKASENILDFAKYIEESNEKILPDELVANYVATMYYKDIQKNIINGTIDKDQLNEYFDAGKKLYDNANKKDNPLDVMLMYYLTNYAIAYDGSFSFNIANESEIVVKKKYSDKMAKEISGKVELPANDFKDKYMVRECIAISDKSENKDLAKEYMAIALSKECQIESGYSIAFSVNKKALAEINEAGFARELEHMEGTNTDAIKDDIAGFVSYVEKMTEPVYIDMILDQIVFDELNNYINGNTSKEEAINSVIEKVNLYMSE